MKQPGLVTAPKMTIKNGRKPKVYSTAGPGSLIESYKHWRDGSDFRSEMAMTYSGQFFSACQALGIELVAVASSPAYPRPEELRDGDFTIRQRPCPWEAWSGPLAQIGEIYGNLGHIVSALRAGADVVVFHGGYMHWYLFTLLRLCGIRLVPVLMVVFWPKYKPATLGRRIIWGINRPFFRRGVSEFASASEDCTRQLTQICGGQTPPVRPFLPKYRPGLFKDISAKPPTSPFLVLFVGRIERYKGVYDLLDIARRFAAEGRTDIEFDLCGAGPVLEDLRAVSRAEGLDGHFRLHGHCEQATLREMYAGAHVVIVPTRTDFVEGFNQVVAEAVISGTPVITSGVCPALESVSEAAVEVPPDDARAYGDAILRLRDDPAFYAEKRAACPAVRERFLNSELTFDKVMEGILGRLLRERGLIPSGD